MFGMPLANIAVVPLVRGIQATAQAIDDRGGVLGRRIEMVTCDDGDGEVQRSKTCLKKLVDQDRIFALITGADWATASIHDDLHQYRLPYVGVWAYSQTEWQDPFMFPTHMSMVHEAMAGARWVRDVIRPRTYGLLCLNSPEMQLACSNVARILDASGSRLVRKIDVNPSETSMSSYILSFRAAAPEHIVHYVMNPGTMAKFMVEAAQQSYWPPKGVSGNHLAAEALGPVLGKWPAGHYWTNTTYRLWGAQFMAAMNRYAKANAGMENHIVQVAWTGMNILARAAAAVGPDLTRQRLMAALGNGVWAADADLDQKFSWTPAERGGTFEHPTWNREMAQGREFMYRYVSEDTRANPDGSPSGLVPDDHEFVIHTSD
jgi:ABC-type branched-subunit amino acid transport system substrate-binding protein